MENNESMCRRFMEETRSRCVMCYIFSIGGFCGGQAQRAAWFLWSPSDGPEECWPIPPLGEGLPQQKRGPEDSAQGLGACSYCRDLGHLRLQASKIRNTAAPPFKHCSEF